MTDDLMKLLRLVEKVPDADLLRRNDRLCRPAFDGAGSPKPDPGNLRREELRASGATQWLPRPISETRPGAVELCIPTFPNCKLIACGRALILAQTIQRRSA